MDFFWGDIKEVAYSGRVVSLPKLHRRITVAITVVPMDVLLVWGEMEFCFNVCRALKGADIELH
jgi:hypothetical protein